MARGTYYELEGRRDILNELVLSEFNPKIERNLSKVNHKTIFGLLNMPHRCVDMSIKFDFAIILMFVAESDFTKSQIFTYFLARACC